MIAAILAAIGGRGLAIGAAVVAGILFTVAVYQTGVNAERKRGEAATLRTKIQALELDIKVAKDAANVARKIGDANEVAATSNAEKVRELTDRLAKRKDAPRLSPADARSLSDIR